MKFIWNFKFDFEQWKHKNLDEYWAMHNWNKNDYVRTKLCVEQGSERYDIIWWAGT